MCNLTKYKLSLEINTNKMKYKLSIILILSSIIAESQVLSSRKGNTHNKSEFQISLIYPIGTNGGNSYNITNNFSINLIAGINGGVNGMEFGGFLNIDKQEVHGIQLAGFGNLNGGNTNGIQMSGFFNVNKGSMGGLQLAGFTNLNSGSCRGIQGAGFLNYNRDSEQIVQLAGFGNISGSFDGIQAAGFFNFSRTAGTADSVDVLKNYDFLKSGMQLAGFVNVAEDVRGIQVAGFANVAKNVEGIMVAGFINICDSINGVPVAFINYVKKNGYRRISVWSNEIFYLNTSFKMGIPQFYTIFNLGYRPEVNNINWCAGAGFGTTIHVNGNKYLDLEGMHHTIFDETIWDYESDYRYHSLNQLKISFRYEMKNRLSVFGGPDFNILVSPVSENIKDIKPSWAKHYSSRHNTIYTWFGFNAGVSF